MSSEAVREGVLYLHYYFSTSKPGHRNPNRSVWVPVCTSTNPELSPFL